MAHAVPIGNYEPQIPVQEGMRRIIPEMSGVSIGPAVEAVGNSLNKVAHANAIARANTELSGLRVAAESAFLGNDLNQPSTSGATGVDATPPSLSTGDILGSFDKQVDAALARYKGDPLTQNMIRQGMTSIRSDLQIRSMHREAVANIQARGDSVLSAANTASAAVELNPDSWQDAGAQQQHALQALGLDPDTTVKLAHEVDQRISDAAGHGYAKRDPLGTLNRLEDATDPLFAGMTTQQRTAVQQYARSQLVEQQSTALAQVFKDNGAAAGTQALAALDKNPVIPADLRDEVRARTNSLVSQLREDSRAQHTGAIVALEENIAKGQVSSADRAAAWNLYRNNALDSSQLAGTLASIDRAEIKQAKDGVSLAEVTAAYTNHTPLDPKDKDVQDAVDTLFLGMTHGVAAGSAEYANRATEIATRTGVVPDSAVSWARANLTSGDVQSAARSADLIARLQESNPRAASFAVDEKTKAMADSISQAVRAGTAPQLAVDQARQNAQLPKEATTALSERWRQQKIDASQPGALESLLKADSTFKPGFFTSLPSVPAAMQGEFDVLTKRYYDLTGGNLQASRALATQDLKRTWGVSEVNGHRELMQYAPEAMFPGLSAEVVRQDIEKTVGDNPQAFQHVNPTSGKLEVVKPDANNIRLIATDRTARTNGLEWQLGAPDEFGALDVLRGSDGNPLTYRLPVTNTDFDAVRERMNQAAIAKARQLQAERAEAQRMADEADREARLVSPQLRGR